MEELLAGISFHAYAVEGNGAEITGEPLATGSLTAEGQIVFPNTTEFLPGWYAIVEVFLPGSLAESLFKTVAPLYILWSGEYLLNTQLPNYWETPDNFVSAFAVGATDYTVNADRVESARLAAVNVTTFNNGLGNFRPTNVNIHNRAFPSNSFGAANAPQGVSSGDNRITSLRFFNNIDDHGAAPEEDGVSYWFGSDADNLRAMYRPAAIYVNGVLAGYTHVAFHNTPAYLLEDFDRMNFTNDNFYGGWAEGWNHLYSVEINFDAGENTVAVIAANSAWSPQPPNNSYNVRNNPAGVIFGFRINDGIGTFDNKVADEPEPIYVDVSFNKTAYNGIIEVNAGDFEFELFKIVDGEEEFIGTFTTDFDGVVLAENLAPGSYVFRELPKLFWDEHFQGEDGAYNLVWTALYPDNADGLYFEINADGETLWAMGFSGTLNNVVACKHNVFWVDLDFYYGTNPHRAVAFNGGWLIYFDSFCHGIFEAIPQEATCKVAGRIWLNCTDCDISSELILAPALGHDFVFSGYHSWDDNGNITGDWYICTRCGTNEWRPVDDELLFVPVAGPDFATVLTEEEDEEEIINEETAEELVTEEETNDEIVAEEEAKEETRAELTEE